VDSLYHLFFICSIARIVWRHSFWSLDMTVLPVADMRDWIQIILNPSTIGILTSDIHLFQIFAAVACDSIWFARNKAHHDNIIPNALDLSATINRIVLEHHSAWASLQSPPSAVWQKPCSPFFKINYDTAIRDSFSAQAAVCRDSAGSIIKCSSLISSPCSAIYGEASAALLAVKLALSLHLSSFILEGDSLTVTLALQQPDHTQDWRIAPIISEALSMIPPTSSWLASHVNRSANFCAHHVANWAATRLHSGCIPTLPFLSGPSLTCFGKASSSSFLVP
jgi:hypothetical protein